jgi:hypothetical protein
MKPATERKRAFFDSVTRLFSFCTYFSYKARQSNPFAVATS